MILRFPLRWLPNLCGFLVAAVSAAPARGQVTVVNPLSAESLATFYHLPEGGGVLPMALYRRLEVIDAATGQPTGQTFAERMSVYGFLADDAADLPVGFSTVPLDFVGGLPALSLNCAACHVGELHVSKPSGVTRLRIVGGPNMADFRRFALDVQTSLARLVVSPGRLINVLVRDDRLQPETVIWLNRLPLMPTGRFDTRPGSPRAEAFYADVAEMVQSVRSKTPSNSRDDRVQTVSWVAATSRGSKDGSAALVDVYRNLQLLIAETDYFLAQGRYPLTTHEGFGRLDAFATVRYLLFPEESADFPFTGPAGVPHLWGIGRKKWLHWNNNTNSTLQRNIVQSLGTGALQTHSGINTVHLPNLASLETIAQLIESPRWPQAVLGPLHADLVTQGRTLYQSRCAACHNAGTVDPATGLIEYRLFTLGESGTDPNYALNYHRPVGTRPFAESLGERMQSLESWYYYRRDPSNPIPMSTQIAWSGGPTRLPAVWRDPLQAGTNAPVYAALPLKGVWATAPYLHNASVPTLRDLLKPSLQRPTVFMVGQREFDPVNVGYVQPTAGSPIPVTHRFDTRDAGNSNAGHEGPAFGADGLTPAEIDTLLEFLKSL
ncbi:MAG: di-heme-cytochrome C peroxidase [Planctomycetaceae bacterium]|nr:di-heme-cytochrome C peroxidase [Planctomycetaceae bacterium]